MTNGSDIFQQMAEKSPNYGALSNDAMGERSKEKMTAMASAGKVASAGIQSLSDATTSMNNAKAGIAKAEAEASATRQNGMMDMFGSIGGAAFGAMKPSFKYGKTELGAGGGVVDGYGTFGPNYGFKQY